MPNVKLVVHPCEVFDGLLLVALVLVAAAVLGTYRSSRRAQQFQRRPVPPSVGLDTKTAATDWEWGQSGNGQPQVKISARNFKQAVNGNNAELEDIELRIFQKDGLHYDRVRSHSAKFDTASNKLFSPGEAQITLSVPVTGDPPHPLTSITTSGINFDSKTGQAVSDQHVSFTFENGDGTCTGAAYDPTTHVLNLNSDVVLNLRGKGPQSKPMKVETGHLEWGEATSKLLLSPWSRLTRDQTVINAGPSVVQLKDQQITWIDAPMGHGTDQQPNRALEYSADLIHVDYSDDHVMQKMNGTGHAQLISRAPEAVTSMSGDRVDLFFNNENGEAVLATATATGNGLIESKPVLTPAKDAGEDAADTRIMKAGVIDLHMRTPGGKEIERIVTQVPNTLEFLPNQPSRHRRLLKSTAMVVTYGPKSSIQTLHATAASTETYPSDDDRKKKTPNLAVGYTSSKLMDATFDEDGQLKTMKQAGVFRYVEGVRKAQAGNATLENATNVMLLEAGARISDDSGSTSADRIQLDQNTGDFDAKGHAFTTRLPEQKAEDAPKKAGSAMLDDDQPMQGSAERVTSANRNHLIHYLGNAVVWQAGNRIQGDKIDIDRDKKSVIGDGKVVTNFQDAVKDAAASAKTQPVFTVVHAQHLIYTDADRLAIYSGGVNFLRTTLAVKSTGLKAYLNEKDSGKDSRVDRAIADGKVEILETRIDRKRLGTSEHAEYFTDDNKVILTGGAPQLDDTRRGNTKGEKLTLYTDNDTLLINGVPEKQVQSHLRKNVDEKA